MSKVIRKRKEGEPVFIPNGDPEIEYEARIGAIVKFPVLEDRGEGYVKPLDFEKYVRAPGSRIIAIRDNSIYMQKEMRTEAGYKYDWRLPGGKIIDSFSEFKQYLNKELPDNLVIEAARKELREEASFDAKSMKIFAKKVCGTTVEWDLYYLVAEDLDEVSLDYAHDEGEEFEQSKWIPFSEIKIMCEKGEIGEGRTVAALVQFLASRK